MGTQYLVGIRIHLSAAPLLCRGAQGYRPCLRPQLFNFLVALPYLGVPISVVLSIWSLLAFLTGMGAILGMDTWQAFLCGALGWAVLQVLQRTIGRPVASMGRWLTYTAAGTKLVTDLKSLERRLDRRMQRRRRIRN